MSEFDWGVLFGMMLNTFGLMALSMASRWRTERRSAPTQPPNGDRP